MIPDRPIKETPLTVKQETVRLRAHSVNATSPFFNRYRFLGGSPSLNRMQLGGRATARASLSIARANSWNAVDSENTGVCEGFVALSRDAEKSFIPRTHSADHGTRSSSPLYRGSRSRVQRHRVATAPDEGKALFGRMVPGNLIHSEVEVGPSIRGYSGASSRCSAEQVPEFDQALPNRMHGDRLKPGAIAG